MKSSTYYPFIVVIIIAVLALNSCECRQTGKGVVFDKLTNKPIDSVYARIRNHAQGKYSDKKGAFELETLSGAPFGCPLMEIVLLKNGYDSVSVKVSGVETDTIYLVKTKK